MNDLAHDWPLGFARFEIDPEHTRRSTPSSGRLDGIRYQPPEIVLSAQGAESTSEGRPPHHQWLPLIESLGGAEVRHSNGPASEAPDRVG